MKSSQLSIFLENRAGRLSEVIHTLAEGKINIRALSLADTSDFGILRLIVCDPDKAKEILKLKGFTVGCTPVVAVEVNDAPGGLDSILQLVSKNNINVEYMYAFVQKNMEKAIMIFRFDKIDEGIEILRKNSFKLIGSRELCAL